MTFHLHSIAGAAFDVGGAPELEAFVEENLDYLWSMVATAAEDRKEVRKNEQGIADPRNVPTLKIFLRHRSDVQLL